MKKIFLSASVPDKDRHPKYFETADVIAIRDAVRALATVVLPTSILVWGGHPAITPLIRFVLKDIMKVSVQEHVILYQSNYFRKDFPVDNDFIETIEVTPDEGDRDKSLKQMREKMIRDHEFSAAVFIGGMEGVEIEYEMFKEIHPNASILPVASTGAAAKIIYNSIRPTPNERLLNDFAYMGVFKALLKSDLDTRAL